MSSDDAHEEFVSLMQCMIHEASWFRAYPGTIPIRNNGRFMVPAYCAVDGKDQLDVMRRMQQLEVYIRAIKWCDAMHKDAPQTLVYFEWSDGSVTRGPQLGDPIPNLPCPQHPRKQLEEWIVETGNKAMALRDTANTTEDSAVNKPDSHARIVKVYCVKTLARARQAEDKLWAFVYGQ